MKTPAQSIGAKMLIGYLALMAVLAIAQWYQVSLVWRMQSINQRLFEVHYRAGLESVRLRSDLYMIDDLTRRFFAVSDRADYAKRLEGELVRVRGRLEDLSELDLSDEEKAELDGLEAAWEEFEDLLSPLLANPEARIPTGVEEGSLRRWDESWRRTGRLIQVIDPKIEAKIAESDAATRRVGTVTMLVLVVALAVGALVGWLIVLPISKSVRRLSEATRGLAQGEFSQRVDESGNDEVAELGRSFNAMVRRLDELDQLKRDFVSHVSHELKAPLASMRETTALLLDRIPGSLNPKQKRLLELNLRSVRRLSAMIQNLLDLSRLEAGAAEYGPHPVDLSDLAVEAVREMEPVARERGSVLRFRPADRSLTVVCDEGRILQVVRNFIDNALKFSPNDSEVVVTTRFAAFVPDPVPPGLREGLKPSRGGYAAVSVADRGPGVPDQHKEKIFDKFHQIERGGKIKGQGVGLGLAISRNIAKDHGAAVWVEDNPGGGAVFRLLLALAETAADDATRLV